MGLALLLLIATVLCLVLFAAVYHRELTRPPRRTMAYALARGLPTDPAELGLSFTEWTHKTSDGHLTPVWDIDVGRGHDKPTLIFVHGWGQSRINMLGRIEPYLPHAARIILYDLRGHGDAPEASPAYLGNARESRDLLELIEMLDASRIVIVGYSLGAVLALNAAAEHPGAIDHIFAHGIYCDFHASLNRRIRWQHNLPAEPFTTLALMWARFRGRPAPGFPTGPPNIPITLIHGHHDPIAPLDDIETLHTQWPTTTLHTFPEAGHLDMHQADADRYQSIVDETLNNSIEPLKCSIEGL